MRGENFKMRNELYHYGVLGMKWGIRRYQNKDGTLTDAGKKRNAKKLEKYFEKAKRVNQYDLSYMPEMKQLHAELAETSKNYQAVRAVGKRYDDLDYETQKKYEERAAREMCAKHNITDKATIDKVIAEYHHHDYRFYDKGDDGRLSFELYLKDNNVEPKVFYDNLNSTFDEYKKSCKDLTQQILGKYGDEKLSHLPGGNQPLSEVVEHALEILEHVKPAYERARK